MSSVCLQRAARACGAVCLAVCLVGGALACLPRRTGERSFPCAVARAHRALPAAGGAPDLAPRGCARIAGGKKISPAADGAPDLAPRGCARIAGGKKISPAADGVFAAECGVSAAGQAFVRAPGAIRPA